MDKLVKIFVELTTPDGRQMLLDTAEIESIFERSQEGYWDANGNWSRTAGTSINMRSGDKGLTRENYSEVKQAIAAAFGAVYSEDE
jgi:hypothetical protein